MEFLKKIGYWFLGKDLQTKGTEKSAASAAQEKQKGATRQGSAASVTVPVGQLYPGGFMPYQLAKNDWLVAGLVFIASLVGYLLTLTPFICAGDSGELTTAIFNLGAAHPPGYPLYTMLGKVFTYIPVSTIAFRVNLLSAVVGALTIPLLYLFLVKIIRAEDNSASIWMDRALAAAGSLLFAFSGTMWSQAVIAEVYTLNIVFAPALLLALLVWQERVFLRMREGRSAYAERYLLLVAFLLGMSFTNHLLLAGYFVVFLMFIAAVFAAVSRYTAAQDSKHARIKSDVVIFGSVVAFLFCAVGVVMLYKNAWVPPRHLLYDKEAMYSLIAIFLPLIGFGLGASIILFSLNDKPGSDEQEKAKRFLSISSGVLLAIYLLITYVDGIRNSLNFMAEPGHFQTVLFVMLLGALTLVLFIYLQMRKQVTDDHHAARILGLLFKGYIFILIPMLLYLTLVIRANAIAKIPDPPLSWGETVSASRVFNHFLRKQYPKSGLVFWPRIVEILKAWGGWHLNQFTPLLLLFVPAGLYAMFRRNRIWTIFTAALFVFFNGMLLYFLSFRVTPRDLFFNEVFFIPSYVIVVTWIAFGMRYLIRSLTRRIDGETASKKEQNNEA